MTPPGVVNLLERDFLALAPETKWVTDITEIKNRQGKLYLCIVLDLYDQRIVGWSMHDRQDRPEGERGGADRGLAASRQLRSRPAFESWQSVLQR